MNTQEAPRPEPAAVAEPLRTGTVIRSISNFYDVLPDATPQASSGGALGALDETNTAAALEELASLEAPWATLGAEGDGLPVPVVRCRARDKLRKELVLSESKTRPRRVRHVRRLNVMDPVAVGDRVQFRVVPSSGTDVPQGIIEEVLPRARELTRQGVTTGSVPVGQTLVANLDQVVLVFAAAEPYPSLGLTDRFLVSCEAAGLPALICLNKCDLGIEDILAHDLAVYEAAGYRVLRVSAETGEGMDDLKRAVQGKISAFVGPSGVGKSSLLNWLQPGLGLRVGEVSASSGKGTHTTRHAQLIPLSFGGFLADTPGIRQLGLWEVSKDELDHFFPEFRPFLGQCRFGNCAHIEEVECAVREAVEHGEVDERRYLSYVKLFLED